MNADYRLLSRASGGLIISLALIVFVGWQFNQPALTKLIPGAPAATPLTALLLLFLGVSLSLLNYTNATNFAWRKRFIWLLAGTAVVIGVFTLIQYLFALKPTLELWLYGAAVQQMQPSFPGRPSPHTAVNSIIIGLAFVGATMPQPKAQRYTTILTLVSAIVPWIALFGYVTLTNPLYTLPSDPQIGMSPITAVSFLFLAVGLLAWQPRQGIIHLFRSDSPGGRIVRRLLPFTILITILFGWTIQVGGNRGWFDPSLAFAISWSLGSLGFIVLIIHQGFSLHRQFQERKQAAEERERMLQKLEKEEEKSRTLLESAPDALVIVNERGKIVIVNEQVEKLFQYQREALIDQPVEILLPERFKSSHPQFRRDYFASPHARPMGAGLDLYGRRRDGQEFPVAVSLNVLKTPDGTLALATIRDVTEQKIAAKTLRQFNNKLEERAKQMTAELRERTKEVEETNAELKRHAEALEQSNLELQQFAYIASHDLQTPLRSISGFVQLLQQEYHEQLDERANEWINITVQNTLRMQTLIRDILAYSRVESPTNPIESVNLNEVANEVCALVKYEIEDKPAEVTVDKLPIVLGNRTHLILLMQNLISNGIKYNNKALPQIHVSAKQNTNEWIIAIQDNGIGISPDYFSKVFEIFRRLHTQEEYPGNGIGLAICRRVVERHGGKIWIESDPDQGSTFYFSLPKEGGANGTKS